MDTQSPTAHLMDSINITLGELERYLGANAHLINEPVKDGTINVRTIDAREALIGHLAAAHAALSAALEKTTMALDKARQTHSKELMAMAPLIDKLNKNEDIGWKIVGKRNKHRRGRTTVMHLGIQCSPTLALSPPTVRPINRVKITESLYLNAICVPSFDGVKQDGELYYVDSADHFALRIAGRLLHGNIGTIYTDERNPEKIKDCRFAETCVKRDNCDYYHNPLKFTGSQDHRNFIASSWLYTPPDGRANRPRARRFGSRDHLDIDITCMQVDDIERFRDQTMHDLLCAFLLDQN